MTHMKVVNRVNKKTFFAPVLLGLFYYIILFSRGEILSLEGVAVKYGFGDADISPEYAGTMILWYLPVVSVHYIYGMYIFRHYCSSAVYYFIRTPKRGRWFIAECLNMLAKIVMFIFFMFAATCFLMWISGCMESSDVCGLKFAASYIFIFALFCFFTSTLMNIIAIISSSDTGFVIVESICLIFVMGLMNMHKYFNSERFVNGGILYKFNPVSHLMMSFHISSFSDSERLRKAANMMIRFDDFHFSAWESAVVFAVLSAAAVCFGTMVVQRTDVIAEKAEG